jgi:hypothetical protein
MSLSYESPEFYVKRWDFTVDLEQEDNNIQHHQYPSPPYPLRENPYNPQSLDASVALANDDILELPQRDNSNPSSPGRAKPIPKFNREVTKDKDGRFIYTYASCAEEIRTFDRKCE